MHQLNKVMSALLGLVGIYILWSVPMLTGPADLLVATALLWASALLAVNRQ